MKENNRKELINKKEFYRNLTRLAFPIALQSLMLASVAAGDALMLGKVAQDEMTAVSLATQIQFVQNMFLSAATAAGAILGAQYWGKGDRRTLEDLFNLMLRFCGIVSILFFAACELMPEQLMHIFAKDEALIAIGSDYLRIAGWSYLLTGISQCYLTTMKVSEHIKPGALISCCAVILNICLNAVFIFGLFGAPRMQARGAALATTVSRVIELVLCVSVSAGASYIRPALGLFLRPPGARTVSETAQTAKGGLYQAVSAAHGRFAVLGNRLYIVHGDYGAHGDKCRCGKLCSCGCPRFDLLYVQWHWQCGGHYGWQ